MKKQLIFLICIVFLQFPQFVHAFSYVIKIPEADIQEKIAARSPLSINKPFIAIALTAPKIKFLANSNDISITSPIDIFILKQFKYSGTTSIRGQLRYDAKRGEFFLDKTIVDHIEVIGLPGKYTNDVKIITQLAADSILTRYPVYKLDDSITHKLAKSLLLSVVVKENNLIAELGY